ncbi:MAG: cbb3-type cytochrome c oxidase subunit I, partial [Acidimicrobiales bacterium]|nr:cbb3-type cytochrome c oxidase subunit I [Acidimicrobiales bacterium]
MTVTETRPDTTAAPEAEVPPEHAPTSRGLPALLGSGDHKVVGRLWIASAFVYLLVLLGLAALLGFEDADQSAFQVLGSDVYVQVFSLSRVGAVFLVAIPLFLGVATFVVPLQVGARSIALPRAAAASFWTWLVAGGILIGSYAIDGGPGGGDAEGIDLWIVAFGLVIVALVAASVSVATTVLADRAEGMRLTRTPLFSWSMLVATSLWILSLPVLAANLLLVGIDHRYGQQLFGTDADVWAQVAWAFHQPQIYVVAIPVFGVVLDVVATASGARPRFRQAAMVVTGLFGVLAFGAWMQPFFNAEALDDLWFIGVAWVSLLTVLGLLLLVGETVGRNRPKLSGPLALAVVSFLLLLGATVAGGFAVLDVLELWDTAFVAGQMHLTVLAAVTGGLAGVWYWLPKIAGRKASDAAGGLVALLVLTGATLVALGMLWSGAL